MIFQNIDFHNVEELVPASKGYAMARIPVHVSLDMNEGIRTKTYLYSTGIELRFKLAGEKATIFLCAEESPEAQTAFIYFGDIQGGWRILLRTGLRL